MKKEMLLVVSAISFILFVYLLSLLIGSEFRLIGCACPNFVSSNFIYIFMLLSIIFIGSLVYYLCSIKIDMQQKIIDKNISLVLNFLDKNERKILEKIINSKGIILQSSLTKKFGKLKTSRIIKKLKQNSIIDVEDIGRTNKIKLKPYLKKELIK
ncbi:MAG: hypothetical protein J7K26_00760 [Candidatus Aenigmarchaeota archaeon]|nr:hypothetical protein [Candidatus Aenigmarchaeota archaeon]